MVKNICAPGQVGLRVLKIYATRDRFGEGFKYICAPRQVLRGKNPPGGAAQTVAKGLVYQKVAILRGKKNPGGAAQTVAKVLLCHKVAKMLFLIFWLLVGAQDAPLPRFDSYDRSGAI